MTKLHLFMCMFPIFICPLMEFFFFQIFCLFQILSYFCLLLNYENSLYILNLSPSLDIHFTNIFSLSMTCIYILLCDVFFLEKITLRHCCVSYNSTVSHIQFNDFFRILPSCTTITIGIRTFLSPQSDPAGCYC